MMKNNNYRFNATIYITNQIKYWLFVLNINNRINLNTQKNNNNIIYIKNYIYYIINNTNIYTFKYLSN